MIKAILVYSWLIFHPVHVTLSSIDYSKGSDSFKGFLKMYYDDFLLDSGRSADENSSRTTVNYESLRDHVTNYLDEKFLIFADKKKLTGKIEDLKLIDGELVINMSFDSVGSASSITVKNLLMTSLYDDQSNMMIVRVNEHEQGLKLTPEKTEHTFYID